MLFFPIFLAQDARHVENGTGLHGFVQFIPTKRITKRVSKIQAEVEGFSFSSVCSYVFGKDEVRTTSVYVPVTETWFVEQIHKHMGNFTLHIWGRIGFVIIFLTIFAFMIVGLAKVGTEFFLIDLAPDISYFRELLATDLCLNRSIFDGQFELHYQRFEYPRTRDLILEDTDITQLERVTDERINYIATMKEFFENTASGINGAGSGASPSGGGSAPGSNANGGGGSGGGESAVLPGSVSEDDRRLSWFDDEFDSKWKQTFDDRQAEGRSLVELNSDEENSVTESRSVQVSPRSLQLSASQQEATVKQVLERAGLGDVVDGLDESTINYSLFFQASQKSFEDLSEDEFYGVLDVFLSRKSFFFFVSDVVREGGTFGKIEQSRTRYRSTVLLDSIEQADFLRQVRDILRKSKSKTCIHDN